MDEKDKSQTEQQFHSGGRRLIDMVYLWVDGSDIKIKEKREFWQKKYGQKVNPQAVSKCRFRDNDELKYSLRSVEKYAPWVNKIFIVTDNQTPEWLNINHPKIRIVNHTEIMPSEALPTFNPMALETRLHKIPGLSEYFIYANDDMMFANLTEPSFFFTEEMYPVFRLKHKMKQEKIEKETYFRSLFNAYKLIEEKYGFKITREPHHSIDGYRKSDFEKINEIFKEEMYNTTISKFREFGSISRVIYSAYACAIGEGIVKEVSKIDRTLPFYKQVLLYLTGQFRKDSLCVGNNHSGIKEEIDKFKPSVICINDDEYSSETQRQEEHTFLQNYFSEKSSFEK